MILKLQSRNLTLSLPISIYRLMLGSLIAFCTSSAVAIESLNKSRPADQISTQALASQLKVGDVAFIRVSALPFKKVASTTMSWTNHVGIVIDISGKEPLIGESTFPLSKSTPLSSFVNRSEAGRIEVSRLNFDLTNLQEEAVIIAARKRNGIFYDTGFNLHSNRQFCSRYVREVLGDATGVTVGETEKFSTFLALNPKTDQTFWKIWYFGNIPWQRETVTPASLLNSDKMHTVFDGYVKSKSL